MIKLSIIIPVYNEEKTIFQILNKIKNSKKENYLQEVLVVNDCSSDNTLKILEENSNLYDLLINNSKNEGKGFAIKKGLEKATGQYIIFQDADLEYDPIEFSNFIKMFVQFDADLVIGSRMKFKNYSRSHNILNLLGNKMITYSFNILNNCTFSDIYSCYIAFKKDLLNPSELKTNGFEQQAEILSKIIKKSKKNYEIPIDYNGRTSEEGKKIKWYHIFSVVYQIIKNKFI